jgi:M6 family metalloprotease-like protein
MVGRIIKLLLIGLIPLALMTPGVPVAAGAPWPAPASAVAGCRLPSATGDLDEGPSDWDLNVQPIGAVKAVMLFVDFPDAVAAGSTADYYDQLAGSVGWFDEVSYGRVSLQIMPVDQWFRMPQASTAYQWPTNLTFDTQKAYIADAVQTADAQVDFGAYDIVYIVPTTTADAISFSPTFISSAGGGVAADGGEIRAAVTFGQDLWDWGFEVLNHETGHIFSLPDLYGFTGSDVHRYVGGWDLMGLISGRAPGYFAWHRWKLGWLDDAQIDCVLSAGESDHTVTPVETSGGTKAVVVRTDETTAYVAEVRQATGVDASVCQPGVLVYEVDSAAPTGYGPIVVEDPHPGTGGTCGGLDDATYALGDGQVSTFTDSTAGVTISVTGTQATAYTLHVSRASSFASYQPDALVGLGSGTSLGDDVYNATGTGQTKGTRAAAGKTKTFTITVQNDATAADSFVIDGPGTSKGFTVVYLKGSSGTKSITSAVTAGTYTVSGIAPGGTAALRVQVTITSSARSGKEKVCAITATSANDATSSDTVKAKVTAA